MQGAEGCCRAVHDAQLCTLALAGAGAETAQGQERKALTLCTSLEQLLLSGARRSDKSALNLFLIWGKSVELLHRAWRGTPG